MKIDTAVPQDLITLAMDYMTLRIPPQDAKQSFDTLSKYATSLATYSDDLGTLVNEDTVLHSMNENGEDDTICTMIKRARSEFLASLVLKDNPQERFPSISQMTETPEHRAELLELLQSGPDDELYAIRNSCNNYIANWFGLDLLKDEYRSCFPNHPNDVKPGNDGIQARSLEEYIDGNAKIHQEYKKCLGFYKMEGDFPNAQTKADYMLLTSIQSRYMENMEEFDTIIRLSAIVIGAEHAEEKKERENELRQQGYDPNIFKKPPGPN